MGSRNSKDSIDEILARWPYEPGQVQARLVKAGNREVLQMRVEMGLLQMETEGRPDGTKPGGQETYYDQLVQEALHAGEEFSLSEEQCEEIDREFVQYYHRRICWLSLHEFQRARQDADHTLALMDFSSTHASDERWVLSHEQYRPFVLFHRIQAAALSRLEDEDAESAVDELDQGLKRFEQLYAQYDAEEQVEDDELFKRLTELREQIRDRFEVGSTLAEQLSQAIEAEEYERAARLRDEIARRQTKR